WIPRSDNEVADYLSKFVDFDDWGVKDSYFQTVNSIWGPVTVDCFANSVNAKVPRFYSLFFQPGCLGVDALAFDWGGENCWLVPPVYLIPRVLVHFLNCNNSSYSALEAAVYGIRWAHDLFGLSNPCDSNLVKGTLKSAKRSLSRPIVKKEPVTPDMVFSICQKFASANANLSDLRTAAICVAAFAGFSRFNELANLRCCDVKFCKDKYVELFIAKSKT
ncbi:unnamed protein product, partial [Porites lobata]